MEKKKNGGFSMVSVMVAFLILLMGIAMLQASLQVSRNMVVTSSLRLKLNDEDMGKVYGYMASLTPTTEKTKMEEVGGGSSFFTIPGKVNPYNVPDSGRTYSFFK